MPNLDDLIGKMDTLLKNDELTDEIVFELGDIISKIVSQSIPQFQT